MQGFDVLVVIGRVGGRVSAILADVEFIAADLVAEFVIQPVNFALMGLETAALGERFITLIAFERTNACKRRSRERARDNDRHCRRVRTCVCARVSLEIERVVESLAAERAQVSFQLTVVFQVSIQQSLQLERLRAQAAGEFLAVVDGVG